MAVTTGSPTPDKTAPASAAPSSKSAFADGDNVEVVADPPTPLDPNDYQVDVPKWRGLPDHMGITGSTVKPRWRLNAELARFAIENPDMSREQRRLVDYAHEVEAKDVDSAWTALNAAKRLLLHDIKDEQELKSRGAALRVKAEKTLVDWRLDAANAILGEDLAPDKQTTPTADMLVQVQEIIDEHNDSRYRQMAIHARSLRYIGTLVVGLLVAFGFVVGFSWITFPSRWVATTTPEAGGADETATDGAASAAEAATTAPTTTQQFELVDSVLNSLGSYIGIVALGAMGALLSVFISRIGGPDVNPLKDLGNRVSGYVRPLLGGLSAVVVVLLLESEVQSIVTFGSKGIYLGALIAGFSERMIDRALGDIAE